MYPSTDCSSPLYTIPELSLTVTGTPMIEDRKLAGSFGSAVLEEEVWFSIFSLGMSDAGSLATRETQDEEQFLDVGERAFR